jgi:hypothetical protein
MYIGNLKLGSVTPRAQLIGFFFPRVSEKKRFGDQHFGSGKVGPAKEKKHWRRINAGPLFPSHR